MTSTLNLKQPGFVPANARLLAAASQAAYGSVNNSDTPNVVPCANEKTGSHAVVTRYEDCTVIAFRGTASLRDWITDAEFPLRRLAGSPGRVHEGFLRAIDAILPDILACLVLPVNQGRGPRAAVPLLLTGHSLGGALAVLAAWFLQRQGRPVHSVYSFGQPRVGDREFAAAYQTELGRRTYRVVNLNDIVPRLPGVLLGYRHAGELAFINALGKLVLNPSLAGRLVADALGLWLAYRRLEEVLITDHFMENYRAALNETGAETSNSKLQTSEKHQASSSNEASGTQPQCG